MENSERINELVELIKKYATSYYTGESEVSDEYFDSLVDELRKIDPDNEVLKTGWGYEPEEGRKKVKHRHGLHIGSLGKIHSVSEIPSNLMNRYTQVRISAKLDGLSVVTYYEDGLLTLALTRGDGTFGIDVTDKILYMNPNLAELKTKFTGAIRGEVIMPQETWDNNPKYLKIQEENDHANPRNFASGIMNRGYLSEELKDLRYVCYKVLYSTSDEFGEDIVSIEEFFNYNSFDVVPNVICFQDTYTDKDFKTLYDGWSKSYPCDGLVLSSLSKGLIYDEIAYKFEAESKEVVVTDVTWNATRTGRLAPRVWFDPVELSGAIVNKATGFNAAFIKDSRIGPGAVIKVCRSGEVIPHIMKVVTPVESVILPDTCPNCGSELVWTGNDLVCESENESQLAYHFITTCAPLDGAGWSLYNKIVEGFSLNSLDSLVNFLTDLRNHGVNSAVRFLEDNSDISGTVTWSKVVKILETLVSPIDYERFLVACNIKGVSWSTVEKIFESYPEIIKDSSERFDEEKLYKIKGVGYNTIQTLVNFQTRIFRLSNNMELKEPARHEKSITQFKVAITGSLSVKRSDFDAELSKRGILQSGNFNEIKYLITNHPESTSSKMKKAKEKGIEIISEKDFIDKYFI